MVRKKLVVPSLRSEKEEADWWEKHKAEVEANLRQAMREGSALSLREVVARSEGKRGLQPVTIRLPGEDIAMARRLANHKGIGYQTYIKLLLHEALRKEAQGKVARERR